MLNVSNEWKRIVADAVESEIAPDFTAKENINLEDGTILNIDESDIVANGVRIDDGTSENKKFCLGSAKIVKHMIYLNNIDGKFNHINFEGAILRPQEGLRLSQTTEWVNKGVFTVDKASNVSGTVAISALDNMSKFETPFKDVVLAFPATLFNILYAVCLYCGVPLATSTFMNDNFTVNRRPDDETITCREIVAWIAQMSGNFARCNADGVLELKWYDFDVFETGDNIDGGTFDSDTPYSTGDSVDGGNFTDYNSGDSIDGGTFQDMDKYHHIYAIEKGAEIATDDVIITGLQVKAMGTESDYGETVLFGESGYVIEITENPLIQEGYASTIANSVGPGIVGMKFRPCDVSAIPDPSREAGDVAYLSDQDGNSYPIMITNLSQTIGKSDKISCDAETPSRKNAGRMSASTRAIIEARKYTNDRLNSYDLAVQRMTNLVVHAFGLYKTEKTLEDGSKIYYSHDKPTLSESSFVYQENSNGFFVSNDGGVTWNSGWDADGNAVMNVLSAIGVDAEWINVLTSFTVGEKFSVDKYGRLKAVDADISGKIIAEMGKIGPYLIDEFGIESDVVRLSEHPLFPGMRLRKRGDSGGLIADEDNNSREMDLQPGHQVFETINDGVKTTISITGKNDGVTDTDGKIIISKVDVSGEFEENISLVELAIDDIASLVMTNFSSGVFTNKVNLTGESLIFEDYAGHTADFAFNDGVLSIGASTVNITGGTVQINGQTF